MLVSMVMKFFFKIVFLYFLFVLGRRCFRAWNKISWTKGHQTGPRGTSWNRKEKSDDDDIIEAEFREVHEKSRKT